MQLNFTAKNSPVHIFYICLLYRLSQKTTISRV